MEGRAGEEESGEEGEAPLGWAVLLSIHRAHRAVVGIAVQRWGGCGGVP